MFDLEGGRGSQSRGPAIWPFLSCIRKQNFEGGITGQLFRSFVGSFVRSCRRTDANFRTDAKKNRMKKFCDEKKLSKKISTQKNRRKIWRCLMFGEPQGKKNKKRLFVLDDDDDCSSFSTIVRPRRRRLFVFDDEDCSSSTTKKYSSSTTMTTIVRPRRRRRRTPRTNEKVVQ